MTSRSGVEKLDIKLKPKPKDGVVLQLHHTARAGGVPRRIRFATAAFAPRAERLACADNAGNLFILDFSDRKFWKLANQEPCSALQFVPDQLENLVVASFKHVVYFVDVETGEAGEMLAGHSGPVRHVAFPARSDTLLTAGAAEAILWDLNTHTKFFTLNTYEGAQIEKILFSPVGDYLVACFQNDTVQIWRHETMKSLKQIVLNDLKHLKSVAFTANGRAMVMAGLSPTLILFSMDTWKCMQTLDMSKFNIWGATELAFVPQQFDGGANKILGVLSNDCALHLLDLSTQTVLHTICPESSNVKRFVVNPTGKYFLCILKMGEINIYQTSRVMEIASKSQKPLPFDQPSTSKQNITEPPVQQSPKTPNRFERPTKLNKDEMEKKMHSCMDTARLRRILMQYGEYPEKFRPSIWRSLLNTPMNKEAYAALVCKGIHPVYSDIEDQFTINSHTTLNSLKRLLSCLAHWCPLFAVIKYLPGFVFPFVRVLQKDPLLLFECVATVLMNYCQLWFEYAPLPPLSVLSIVENVLAEHDKSLLDHLCKKSVTSQVYAMTLLETAFSEVLTCTEWLILWDHVLSNEPAYFLLTVVSYNMVQRNTIMEMRSRESIDDFFHWQNPINKKIFLKKAYHLLETTSQEVHPRSYIEKFKPLKKGLSYQQFEGYPKATICLKLAKKAKMTQMRDNETLRDLTRKCQEREIQKSASEVSTRASRDAVSLSHYSDGGGERPRIKHFPKEQSRRQTYSKDPRARNCEDYDDEIEQIILTQSYSDSDS